MLKSEFYSGFIEFAKETGETTVNFFHWTKKFLSKSKIRIPSTVEKAALNELYSTKTNWYGNLASSSKFADKMFEIYKYINEKEISSCFVSTYHENSVIQNVYTS